jgi:hypothetical protein
VRFAYLRENSISKLFSPVMEAMAEVPLFSLFVAGHPSILPPP